MTRKNNPDSDKAFEFQMLDKRAKKKSAESDKPLEALPASEMPKLIHELHSRRMGLDMQNEALRKRQAGTERSRKAYEDLWQLSPVACLIVDFAGRVTAVNRAGQRLFGRPESALLGERFSMLVDPENQMAFHLMFEKAVEAGIFENQEIRILKPDGAIRICELEVGSLGGEPGREQFQAVLRDITRQKRAEDDLRKNEQEKIGILDSLMEHVIYHDREMRILWANRAACESARMTRENLLGGYCYEVWAERRSPCEDCPVIKARETRQPQTLEKMTPDGRWWYIQCYTVRDDKGHVIGTTEITLDITDRKRVEEQLRKAKDEIESQKDYLQNILDTVPVYIFLKDRDHRLTHVNEALVRATGRPRREWIGKTVFELFSDRDLAEKYYQDDEEVMSRGGQAKTNIIETLPTPEGIQWLHTQKVPLKSETGHIVGLAASSIDTTERNQLEEALRRAKNELETKVEERTAELVETTEKLREEIRVRKKAEKELRESEMLLSSTFDSLQDVVVVIDRDFRVLMSNWKDHEYIPEKDRRGHPFCYEVFMHRSKPCNPCQAMDVFATGQIEQYEHENPIDGKVRDIRILPVFDDKGNVAMVIEHLRDITERKQSEKALEESEKKYREIFQNSPIGFYRTTPDGRILDANPALIEMLGYASFDELAAINLETHEYHPEYSRRDFKERIERDGEIKGMEGLWKKKDGTFAHIRENARGLRHVNGSIVCYEGTVEDLTQQKEAQRKIHTLSRQLIQAHESERQMISRELHDTIAQDLAAAKIGCDTLFDKSSEYSPLLQEKIEGISKALQHTIKSVRDLSYDLRPPGLDQIGFVETISDYCEDFSEKTGVEIEVSSVDMDHCELDSNMQINLYRLVQEGLNNVRKHADASRTAIGLVGSLQKIILTVEDNGRGFDVEKRMASMDNDRKMGLRSMEERTRLLGGKFDIRSSPGKGTSIKIEIPFLDREIGW